MPSALAIRKSGWKDLFIARELHVFPSGVQRYLLLAVKALASCLAAIMLGLGPLTSLIVHSQGIGVEGYGYMVGAVGLFAAVVGLVAADIADRFSRVRLLLWGTTVPIMLQFVLSYTPDGAPTMFIILYTLTAWTEAFAIVTVSALLRDFSPRTGRAVGVGLVTVGTLTGNWLTAFLAGQYLEQAGSWQVMLRVFCFVCVGVWVLLWLFGREPSRGIRSQVMPSLDSRREVEANAQVLERQGVSAAGFWAFIRADWRLWALATGQGLFLLGYITFVYYGPLLTELSFGQTPQEASATTSWVFLSIIVFLVVGGILSDKLRLRKSLGFTFTVLTGFGLLGLGVASGQSLSSGAVTWIYIGVGAVMAMMWSPTNALFSETAEDIHATRQTTAFGGQHLINRIVYQSWIFVLPLVLVAGGVEAIWFVAAAGAFLTAPILVMCRGGWGRFPVEQVEVLDEAKPLLVGSPDGAIAEPAVPTREPARESGGG